MSIYALQGTIINDYKIIKLIGTGAYGLVFLVKSYSTGEEFAMKIIAKKPQKLHFTNGSTVTKMSDILLNKFSHYVQNHQGMLTDLASIDLDKVARLDNFDKYVYLKELSVHLRVHDHPNVITIHEILDSSLALFIVMDYFPEGDLFSNIVDKQVYSHSSPQFIKTAFVQLLDGVSYCHSKGVYHCDLKPENIMCAAGGSRLMIGDFGLSILDRQINATTCIGSSYYMPPERLISMNHNLDKIQSFPADKGDIWSLAIILINLTCTRNPWMKACQDGDQTYSSYLTNSRILKDILPINEQLYQVLAKCLVENPFKRSSIFEIREQVIKCTCFTTSGPLSIPEKPAQKHNHISYLECIIPRTSSPTSGLTTTTASSSVESHDEPDIVINKVHESTNYYKLLNEQFGQSCYGEAWIDDAGNYSTMTNVSYDINAGLYDHGFKFNEKVFNA